MAELISAEDDESRRAALRQLHGAVAGEVTRLREQLLDFVARVEAALDFEEGEIPDDLPSPVQIAASGRRYPGTGGTSRRNAGAAQGIVRGVRRAANSGKSSIFNYLLDFERSIVAPFPGTTRDYIEERSVIGGTSITLIDTAGLRATDDSSKPKGSAGASSRSRRPKSSSSSWMAQNHITRTTTGCSISHPPVRRSSSSARAISLPHRPGRCALPGGDLAMFTLSSVTGEGFPDFIAALTSRCRAAIQAADPSARTERPAPDALERAADTWKPPPDMPVQATGSSTGWRSSSWPRSALGEITGQTATEEILERIFSRFCVGK